MREWGAITAREDYQVTVRFVGENEGKKFCFVFQDQETQDYYLDETVCSVTGLNPLIYDQLREGRYFKVGFQRRNGMRYIDSIELVN